MKTRQYDFLATIINAETSKVSILYSIYSIIGPEVRGVNGGHGHAHAIMGFLKAASKEFRRENNSTQRCIMGDEAGGR